MNLIASTPLIEAWDRAIFIPWETRYVQDGEDVDPQAYRLPADNMKKANLVKLTDAFITVCLKSLHGFIQDYKKKNPERTLPTDVPVPDCVNKMVAAEKERAFPLKMFIKEYLVEAGASHTVSVELFFAAYRGFLRIRNIKTNETMDDIVQKFRRVGMKTAEDNKRHLRLVGYKISEEAQELAQSESSFFGESRPIMQAFKRQKVAMQSDEHKEEDH